MATEAYLPKRIESVLDDRAVIGRTSTTIASSADICGLEIILEKPKRVFRETSNQEGYPEDLSRADGSGNQ